MNKDEYQKFWGTSLIKYLYTLENSGLPESTCIILKEWGLPLCRDWNFKFSSLKSTLKNIKHTGHNHFIFGYDYEVPLTVRTDGKIWCIPEEENEAKCIFVNTSLESFAGFLCFFQQYRKKVKSLKDEDKITVLIQTTADRMCEADAEAMANEEFYWRIIIEQMEYGML
jgi:hypothetical protein